MQAVPSDGLVASVALQLSLTDIGPRLISNVSVSPSNQFHHQRAATAAFDQSVNDMAMLG